MDYIERCTVHWRVIRSTLGRVISTLEDYHDVMCVVCGEGEGGYPEYTGCCSVHLRETSIHYSEQCTLLNFPQCTRDSSQKQS